MTQQYDDRQVSAAAAAFAASEVTYYEDVPAQLPEPPDTEPMVPLGIRLPPALAERVRKAGEKAGVPYSQLIREWIELGLTEMVADQAVSLSALRRAIAHVAQSGHPA